MNSFHLENFLHFELFFIVGWVDKRDGVVLPVDVCRWSFLFSFKSGVVSNGDEDFRWLSSEDVLANFVCFADNDVSVRRLDNEFCSWDLLDERRDDVSISSRKSSSVSFFWSLLSLEEWLENIDKGLYERIWSNCRRPLLARSCKVRVLSARKHPIIFSIFDMNCRSAG